jgi:putative membrane protein
MNRGFKEYLAITLKGMGMGAADVVPGVSGGTIAFISGIYEELINSIKSINLKALQKLFKEGFVAFWKHVNGSFLLALFTGISISVLTLAKIIEIILINHPILIWSFFFGLIIASAIFVAKKITRWKTATFISIVAGTAIAFYITMVSPAETTTAYWFVFISGALAICAMILPGISGSFILLLLGKYQFVLNAVNEAKLDVIAILGIGAVVGLLSFSNLLSWLLRKYHDFTVALLAGFMIGSLNKIWPWKVALETFIDSHGVVKPLVESNVTPAKYALSTGSEPMLFPAILLATAGFMIIYLVEIITATGKKV